MYHVPNRKAVMPREAPLYQRPFVRAVASCRGLLSDFKTLRRLRRLSLSEVVTEDIVAARSSSGILAHEAEPCRPAVIPLVRWGRGLFAVTDIAVAKAVLRDGVTYERAAALASFATAFDLQSVFTTSDKNLRCDLKRYFQAKTNNLAAKGLSELIYILSRHVAAMVGNIDVKAPIPLVPKIEGMVLGAYAEAFFSLKEFSHWEECTDLIKQVWQLKSLRNNIPTMRFSPQHYVRFLVKRRRLFSLVTEAESLIRQTGSAAADEMAEVYNVNGYVPGNLLNALIPLYEAISRGIIFALIELARNPQIQTELRDEVLANMDAEVEYCASKATLLHRVWQETLRLHPPTPNQTRQVTGENDLCLPRGSRVVVVWSVFHADPEVWGSDAAMFKPSRWLAVTPEQAHNYNPFGSGAQHCVAMHYANLGSKTILKRILECRVLELPKGELASVISDRAYSRGPDRDLTRILFAAAQNT